MTELKVVLEERGKSHGRFADNARLCQDTRRLWRTAANWNEMPPEQQLALDEIALKAARILSVGSSPEAEEHWLDVAGYAELGRRACHK
jgi:hypothetical protein